MATKIDLVFIRGGQGGFENILNRTTSYLAAHDFDVRFVQLMPAKVDWATKDARFVCLYESDTTSFTYDDARSRYARLLSSDEEKPALILATGWPTMVYVAKGATMDVGAPIPVCAWLHGDIRFYEESDSGGLDVLQYADMCVGISHGIANDVYQAYPDKTVYRVNNAIDESVIRYAEDRNTRKLAYVGRLSEEKAVPIILYALERAKTPWELTIVGSGEEENALRDLTRKLRLQKRVHFAGWSDTPYDTLTDCRAIAVSSLYEGGPLCAIEGLACGMQVVSTPCGCLPELIRENETGWLYPFAEVDALAKALDKMGATPFTAETAKRCRASVEEFFPAFALRDFMRKIEACARCVALPARYSENTADYYVRT